MKKPRTPRHGRVLSGHPLPASDARFKSAGQDVAGRIAL